MSNITWLYVLVAFAVITPVLVSQVGLYLQDSPYTVTPNFPEAAIREINEEDYNFSAWNVFIGVLNFLASIFNQLMNLFTGLWIVLNIIPLGLSIIISSLYFFLIAHIIVKLLPTT